MPSLTLTRETIGQIRWAGLLYLVIIICGLGAELCVRGQLVDSADAAATASAILGQPGLFRLAIAADLVMAMADIGLAILLFLVFRTMAPGLALAAMVFRLVQAVIIAANLMAMQAAWLVIAGDGDPAQALFLLDLHGHGYDLGLFFFGINSLLTGWLVWRSGVFGKLFGLGLMLAGLVYLAGSSLHFFAPDLLDAFTPAYGVTILAEAAFCLRLLLQRGIRAPG
jgi:hypothetical protein